MTAVVWAQGHCDFPQVAFRRIFEPMKRPVAGDSEIVTAYTDGVVTLRRNRRLDGYHEAADLSGFQGIQEGDFVVHGLDILRGSVGVSDSHGAISSVCNVCRLRVDGDPRYFAYVMRAQALSGLPRALARGVREGGADFRRWDTLGALPLPVPAPQIQRAVADFLDSETARDAALIAKKRQLVDLLAEKEQAAIDRMTVPSSLNGVADLQEEHRWPTTSLKKVATFFTDGDWVESRFITDSGIRLLQTGNVQRGAYREQGFRYISETTFHELKCTEVYPGDVLISRLAGPVGCACIAPDLGERMVASVDVVIMRPVQAVLSEFLVAYLSSARHLALAELVARGTTMQRLSRSQVGDLPVPLPPLDVQRDVVDGVSAVRCHAAALRTRLRG